MPQSERFEPRDLLLPIVVGATSTLIALGLWWLLLEDRRASLEMVSDEAADQSVAAVAERLDLDRAELVALGHAFAETGDGAAAVAANVSGIAWARELIDRREGLVELVWQPVRSSARLVVNSAGVEAVPNADGPTEELPTIETLPPSGALLRLVGPVDQRLAEVDLRVPEAGEALGVLRARFSVEEWLGLLFRGRALHYAVEVEAGDVPLYARGEPADPLRAPWWREARTIETPFGQSWAVGFRPTAHYAEARLNPLPHYLLFIGVVLSGTLAFLSHQLRRTLRRAQETETANLTLRQHGASLAELNAELEARVAVRTAELEDAVSELKSLNYSVSHDLRSPIGAMMNFASIVEEDFGEALGEDGRNLIGRIKRSGEKATRLIEDLLQLSRAGRSELQRETVDLRELASNAWAQALSAEQVADRAGEVDFQLGELPKVDCDPHLIGIVFDNFFTNALKYSRGQDRRRIVVDGREREGQAVVEVQDNGRGFDMRFASKLFQVFERLHRDEEIEGNGVGLAIVARVVKRHGGSVWAESAPGEGARFSFSLPTRPPIGDPGDDRS